MLQSIASSPHPSTFFPFAPEIRRENSVQGRRRRVGPPKATICGGGGGRRHRKLLPSAAPPPPPVVAKEASAARRSHTASTMQDHLGRGGCPSSSFVACWCCDANENPPGTIAEVGGERCCNWGEGPLGTIFFRTNSKRECCKQ